jgi:probable F420-dependent oxidoreductase
MAAATLTLGLTNFAASPPAGGWGGLVERARVAERAGIDRVVVVDHVVMGEHLEAYDGGRFPTGPDGAWLEPLTVLSVIAGATERVRLGTGILIAPLRRAAVLAKAAATLDVLSGGRLDLGVGVGWQREEYDAAGLAFEERGALLDETLAVCRALWAGGPTSYRSERLSFESVWCEPRPVQPGGVPIWVAGRLNARTLARIVRFGDGWIPWGEHIASVEQHVPTVHEALAAAGRDPSRFEVRGQLAAGRGDDLAVAMEPVPRMVEAGVTDFSLGVRLPDDGAAAEATLAAAVAAFRAATA